MTNPPPPAAGGPVPGAVAGYPTKTSTSGITSLIFGIVGFFLPVIGPLIAIILGIVCLCTAGKVKDGYFIKGKGLGVAGLILGILGILMIFLIAIPAYNGIQANAVRSKNLSNAKQVVLACRLYATDNNGAFPADTRELLEGNYVTSDEMLAYDDRKGTRVPWLYFSGLNDADSPRNILIASPAGVLPDKRIMVTADYAGAIVMEDEYRRRLSETGQEEPSN